jgi:2-polyprenyl-6-methoxyphenol hydroxylase-like FAD-dependent oxidoreductase
MQRWGARVRVFERDRSFDERAQGYGLTVQQGGAALRALGADGLGSQCLTATLHVSFLADGTPLGRYGHATRGADAPPKKRKKAARNFLAPRQQLRQQLLDLLAPGTVQWGCSFASYEPARGGSGEGLAGASAGDLLLRFDPDRSGAPRPPVRAAVVIGADGIFSRVAQQRLLAELAPLAYTGYMVVLGIAPLGDALRGEQLLDPRTISETVDGRARLYMMSFGRTEHMWQLSLPLPLAEARALQAAGPPALLAEARRRCGGWHEPLPALLHATPSDRVTGCIGARHPTTPPHTYTDTIPPEPAPPPPLSPTHTVCSHGPPSLRYPVFDRDPLPLSALRPVRAEADGAVTLLGDALHPMAPFKGQGANQARPARRRRRPAVSSG